MRRRWPPAWWPTCRWGRSCPGRRLQPGRGADAAAQRTGRSATFTVGFADRAFDESAEAAAVAAHLGTDHTLLWSAMHDAADVIPRLPDIWDEPFGDISQLPMLLVSRLARSAGDRGAVRGRRRRAVRRLQPACLAGAAVAAHVAPLPDPVRRLAGSALGRVPPRLVDGAARATTVLPVRLQVRNPATKLAKVGKVLAASDPEDAYLSLVSHWDGPSRSCVALHADRADRLRPVGVAGAGRDHRADALARPGRATSPTTS